MPGFSTELTKPLGSLANCHKTRGSGGGGGIRPRSEGERRLPPAEEDHDEDVCFVDTEASDPEDEIIDPGAAADAPPPGMTHKEATLAEALLEAAQKVPSGRDSSP